MTWLSELRAELGDLEQSGRRRMLRTLVGSPQRVINLDGQSVLNFSSNNYLGLAQHPVLSSASSAASEQAGTSTGASRLILGNQDRHQAFERAVADYHRRPRALLFNSGYNANIGILQALTDDSDVIFSDQLNHASIIDGCRLSRARVIVYPHADLAALDRLLIEHRARRRYIVSDSVFSMDGDRAPLIGLDELCHRHGAILILDEAHAVGALGPGGRGIAAEVGIRPGLLIGTLGKSFGSFGAYVCGETEPIELLLNRARSFVFTTALPPGVIAASTAALTLIESADGEHLRQRLDAHIERFRAGFTNLGLLLPGAGTSPIFPVLIGDEARAMACCDALLKRGIYAQGIRPPTVASGTCRLRFTLMANHESDDLNRALSALAELASAGHIPQGIT